MGGENVNRAGTAPASPEEMIAEARKAFFVMFALLAVVWLVQLANFADHYALSRDYAVVSGDPGTLPDAPRGGTPAQGAAPLLRAGAVVHRS